MGRSSSLVIVIALFMVGQGGLVEAQESPGDDTLLILDFNRLGDDASMDWLKQGLSDLMTTTINRASSYQLIDREHLKEILREEGLVSSGLVDETTAIRQAHLAKAQLLLLGNFATTGQNTIIQVRLVRLTDLKILSTATSEVKRSDVLLAPKTLCQDILAGIGRPFDARSLEGLAARGRSA